MICFSLVSLLVFVLASCFYSVKLVNTAFASVSIKNYLLTYLLNISVAKQ